MLLETLTNPGNPTLGLSFASVQTLQTSLQTGIQFMAPYKLISSCSRKVQINGKIFHMGEIQNTDTI